MNLSKVGDVTAGRTKTSGVSDFMELPLKQLYPNPAQPRKSFDKIEELAASIKEHGLLQPITVTKDGLGKYMILAGERRYRAVQMLERDTAKCFIATDTNDTAQELALVENIQRDDLSDFEIANYIAALWYSGKYEQKQQLADKLGKSKSYVSKALGVVDKLDESIKQDISAQQDAIGLSIMEELSRVPDKGMQKSAYKAFKKGSVKRDDIKKWARDFPGETKRKKKRKVIELQGHMLGAGSEETKIILSQDLTSGQPNVELGGIPGKTKQMLGLFDSNKKYKITIEEL